MPEAVLVVVLTLATTSPAWAQGDEDDPIEPVNRAIFAFNNTLDGLILDPAARIYRYVTPQFFRDGVTNFLNNLRTPIVLTNDLLQGEFKRAEHTFGRFMLNTILGVGGLVDVGGWAGMPERHSEDFGQTLAVYGVGEGFYLVLPVLGPSNPRDAVGRLADVAMDPFSWFLPLDLSLARTGTTILSFREENIENIDELKRTSIDFYAAIRTVTRQLRESEIRNGAPAPIEDIYDEDLYELDDLQDPAASDGQ